MIARQYSGVGQGNGPQTQLLVRNPVFARLMTVCVQVVVSGAASGMLVLRDGKGKMVWVSPLHFSIAFGSGDDVGVFTWSINGIPTLPSADVMNDGTSYVQGHIPPDLWMAQNAKLYLVYDGCSIGEIELVQLEDRRSK